MHTNETIIPVVRPEIITASAEHLPKKVAVIESTPYEISDKELLELCNILDKV